MKKFFLLTKTLLVAVCLLVGATNAWAAEWSVDFGAIISAEHLTDKTEVYASTESTVTIGGTTMGTVTLGSTAVNANFVMQTGEKWLARTAGYIHNQSSNSKSFAIRNCLAGQIIILRVGNATVNSATNATLLSGENGVNIYKVIADGDVKISHARYLYIYSVKVLNSYTITDESFPFTSSFGTNSNPFVGANYNVSGTNVSNLIQVTNTGAVALFDTSESPSGKYAVKEGEKLTISFTAYNGYYASGTTGVSIKNSDGVVLAGYTYSLSNSAVTVTVGGEVVSTGELTGRSYYSGTSGANGLSNGSNRGYVATAGMNPVVTLTLMNDGTLTFSIIGGSANYTYTTPVPLEAKMDVASFAIYCTADNSDRTFCMGNLSVNAEPLTVATPTFTIGSYNYEQGGYAVTPSCATEGATLTYTIGGGAATACTSGVPFYAKGGKLNITASKAGWTSSSLATDDQWTLNTAPSSTSPETLIPFQASSDNGDKNIEHVYKSVTIAGGNNSAIAGISGNTALKMRTGNSGNTITLNVNSGYTITRVSIAAKSNNKAATIGLTSTTVDGGSNIMTGTTTFPISTAESAVTFDTDGTAINAKNNIVFTFDNSAIDGTTDKKNKQILATIKVWYKTPVDIAIDDCKSHETSSAFATAIDAQSFASVAEVYAFHTQWQIAQADAASSNDITKVIFDAAVYDFSRWNDGRSNHDQQYTGAPDSYYFDGWDKEPSDGKQKIYGLPAGTYTIKVATRASATLTDKNKYNVWVYGGSADVSVLGSHIGSTGGTLGNGWNWTILSFTLAEKADVEVGFYANPGTGSGLWAGCDDFHLYKGTLSASGTITPAGWASFSSTLPLDLSTISGGTAYYASASGESSVTLAPTTAKVPANTGLMIKGTAGATFTIATTSDETTDLSASNLLKATDGSEIAKSPESGEGNYHYVFGYKKPAEVVTEYGFYNLASATSVEAGKAYLEITKGETPARALRISLGGITEVENIEAEPEATVKKNGAYLENGKIAIYKNGMKFNANGQLIK